MIWSPTKKILFRFFCLYIFLYIISCQFVFSFALTPIWDTVVPWFGEFLTGQPINVRPNGSGDTTYNYIQLLVFLLLSIIFTIIWSVLDKKRANYQKLFDWLVVLVRYYLVYQMLLYGFGKIFYLQFGPPSLDRLEKPVGDLTPMAFVWTFVGYSKAYTMLSGWLEVIGGTLLLFKRTQTLGAMFVLAVMVNVAAFNYFYDVPVKLLSTHIIFFALFLLGIDAKRLINTFILNRPTEPREIRPLFKKEKIRKIKNGFKWTIVLIVYIDFIIFGFTTYDKIYGAMQENGIMGTYDVIKYSKNNYKNRDKEFTDWEQIKITSNTRATVENLDKLKTNYTLLINPLDSTVQIKDQNTKVKDTINVTLRNVQYLSINGIVGGDTLSVVFLKRIRDNYVLQRHKFRWINEYPDK